MRDLSVDYSFMTNSERIKNIIKDNDLKRVKCQIYDSDTCIFDKKFSKITKQEWYLIDRMAITEIYISDDKKALLMQKISI